MTLSITLFLYSAELGFVSVGSLRLSSNPRRFKLHLISCNSRLQPAIVSVAIVRRTSPPLNYPTFTQRCGHCPDRRTSRALEVEQLEGDLRAIVAGAGVAGTADRFTTMSTTLSESPTRRWISTLRSLCLLFGFVRLCCRFAICCCS